MSFLSEYQKKSPFDEDPSRAMPRLGITLENLRHSPDMLCFTSGKRLGKLRHQPSLPSSTRFSNPHLQGTLA